MESEVDSIVDRFGAKPTALIAILQEVQKQQGYLSEEALRRVAQRVGIELAQIYGVATYYRSFRLSPPGRHSVVVCMGTACHVRQAPRVLDALKQELGIEPGQTTRDGLFSLQSVNCLGACALGPIVVIDDKYYAKMTPLKARKLIQQCRKRAEKEVRG
jgi:NADH-quinone oxidoreductase subunit E